MSTGCMMTPGHGENIGNKLDKVQFLGAVQAPGKTVCIQGKDRYNRWQNIATAKSTSTPYRYSGSTWYLWSREIAVPHHLWHIDGDPWHWKAEIRVIDISSGDALATFEEGFFEYFDPEVSLADLVEEHLHGETVTIYSTTD